MFCNHYINLVNKNKAEELKEIIKNCECTPEQIIYSIKNTITEEEYIGQTNNFESRKRKHLADLNKGNHQNYLLQKSFDIYSKDAFDFKILDTCDENVSDLFERYYIKCCGDKSLNLTEGGKKFYHLNDYSKQKISRKKRQKYNIETMGVTRQKDNRHPQGYYFVYQYYENGKHYRFSSLNLQGLQKKAIARGIDLNICEIALNVIDS